MGCILAIDDDEDFLATVAEMLTGAGHTVITASNGARAVALFRTVRFDVIVTDIVMPEKEGIATIIELHRDFPDVPVIAMSGDSKFSGQYLQLATKLGADHALEKPFTRDQLANALTQVLAKDARKNPKPRSG